MKEEDKRVMYISPDLKVYYIEIKKNILYNSATGDYDDNDNGSLND